MSRNFAGVIPTGTPALLTRMSTGIPSSVSSSATPVVTASGSVTLKPAAAAQLPGDGFSPFEGDVVHRDRGALVGEHAGDADAHSLAGAGDERGVCRQIEHWMLLVSGRTRAQPD